MQRHTSYSGIQQTHTGFNDISSYRIISWMSRSAVFLVNKEKRPWLLMLAESSVYESLMASVKEEEAFIVDKALRRLSTKANSLPFKGTSPKHVHQLIGGRIPACDSIRLKIYPFHSNMKWYHWPVASENRPFWGYWILWQWNWGNNYAFPTPWSWPLTRYKKGIMKLHTGICRVRNRLQLEWRIREKQAHEICFLFLSTF